MAEWDEGLHPRDRGKFASKPGSEKAALRDRDESTTAAASSLHQAKSAVAKLDHIKTLDPKERGAALRSFVKEETPSPEPGSAWHGNDSKPDAETWGKYMKGSKGEANAVTADKDRKELHEAIKEHFAGHVQPVPNHQQPDAIFTMGAPATGKSSMGEFDYQHIVRIDPDEIKGKLPEYRDGVRSMLKSSAMNVHEESSTIAKQLRNEAMASNKNFLMDGTGKNATTYVEAIEAAQKAGYHVEVKMAYLDRDKAKERGDARAERSGRWVKPDVFETAHVEVPKNWERIARVADSARMYDTDVPRDTPARLVWSFENGRETQHDPEFVKRYKAKHG
jgi:predicted ABC-type ATPase